MKDIKDRLNKSPNVIKCQLDATKIFTVHLLMYLGKNTKSGTWSIQEYFITLHCTIVLTKIYKRKAINKKLNLPGYTMFLPFDNLQQMYEDQRG